jgi:hypothetical protein
MPQADGWGSCFSRQRLLAGCRRHQQLDVQPCLPVAGDSCSKHNTWAPAAMCSTGAGSAWHHQSVACGCIQLNQLAANALVPSLVPCLSSALNKKLVNKEFTNTSDKHALGQGGECGCSQLGCCLALLIPTPSSSFHNDVRQCSSVSRHAVLVHCWEAAPLPCHLSVIHSSGGAPVSVTSSCGKLYCRDSCCSSPVGALTSKTC